MNFRRTVSLSGSLVGLHKTAARLGALLLLFLQGHAIAVALDYDQMVLLDAENLAETGIKTAYESLLPKLEHYVSSPVSLEERIDNDTPRYSVSAAGTEYVIYGPGIDNSEGRSWGRATWALFSIVNKQLEESTVRFYAINGGNELGGMFLTAQQVEHAKRSLPHKTDWPYTPSDRHPWYGQHH